MLVVLVLWLLALTRVIPSLWSAIQFKRFVLRALCENRCERNGPPVTIILPCCGVDDRLRQTIDALGRQNYADYDVIFTFESTSDSAYAAVGAWADAWRNIRWQRVVAGLTQHRSQKIHNLLAALEHLAADRHVLAFLDSDAVPHADWLAYLIAPLGDEGIGATTGFRWYSAGGGWVEGVRSSWNAAVLSFFEDRRLSFCWGGSTAIRRETFDRCSVAARWENSLSDDLQMTQALRAAGLDIRFVPQCLIPCHEATTLSAFLRFARRQLVITRVYTPTIWLAAFMLGITFTAGAAASLIYSIVLLCSGHYAWGIVWLAAWLTLVWIGKGNAIARQAAVARILRSPDWTRRDWSYDVLGSELMGALHFGLLVSSAVGRRVAWRHTVYEMISPVRTVVVSRPGLPVQPADPRGDMHATTPSANNA